MGKKIGAGAVAGLIGGLVFDVLMRVWPMSTAGGGHISMIAFAAQLVHARNPRAGWVVYLVYAVVIGVLFAWLYRSRVRDEWETALWGVLYGFGWWLVAGLVLAPALLGHPPFSSSAVESMRDRAVPLLAGHVIYGAVLGVIFPRIRRALGGPRRPSVMADAARRAA